LEIDKKEFKKKYPKLIDEMEYSDNKIKIDPEKKKVDSPKNDKGKKRFRGYEPSIIDFIQRCTTTEEANSIIDYLENRGEISKKYANNIRDQIKDKGVRSFGPKKKENYYFKNNIWILI